MESITIDHLPPEVIVMIFNRYVETEGPVKLLRNVSPVCKQWRSLCSASTYMLWKKVSWKSMSWNFDHLLELGERGYLASTRIMDLSTEDKKDSPKMIAEDFLKVINYCHNVKCLNISHSEVITEKVMKALEVEFQSMEKLAMQSADCNFEGDPYQCHRMVPLKVLEPIFRGFRQTLTHLHLKCHFARDDKLISEIARSFPNLEEFYFENYRFCSQSTEYISFPIGELRDGCPKLRVLTFFYCKFELSKKLKEGFREMKSFKALGCDFKDLEVIKIFENSTQLEDLDISRCRNLVFNRIFEIPSNKVKIFRIGYICFYELNLEPLEIAVKKWRRTLEYLFIDSCSNVTGIVKAFLEDNQDPVIERMIMTGSISTPCLESLVRDCKKLKCLKFRSDNSNRHLEISGNREEVEKSLNPS